MELSLSKVTCSSATTTNTTISKSCAVNHSSVKFMQNIGLYSTVQGRDFTRRTNALPLSTKLSFASERSWCICRRYCSYHTVSWRSDVLCLSNQTHDTKTNKSVKNFADCSNVFGTQLGGVEDKLSVMPERTIHSSQGLAEACKFAYNDAKFVSERARNDVVLLSRGIMRLDARAREDFSIIGLEFLKLNARAREDTEKIDHDVKKKAECLHHMANIIKDKAHSKLKSVADKHWSNGALEADLRRADFCAKQRAMEDGLMALEFIKEIHDRMISKLYKLPLCRKRDYLSTSDDVGRIMLEKNGKTIDFFAGEVSPDHVTAIQEAYWSMATALSEADGIDYTNPEELELLVALLIDLDAIDGKSSVSLLAECSNSPDINTRKALAKALAAAPSMWTLGNAGMGALQRLAGDDNPAIAAAATRAICELRRQWKIKGDTWRFMMDEKLKPDEDDQEEVSEDGDTSP